MKAFLIFILIICMMNACGRISDLERRVETLQKVK